ncbi:MAG: chromosome segregation protein SMC [Neisseriaceae bacterium]
MKLKQIKLSGFKSFVDNITINVDGSLVGIVGPNGCGKSNIIDAIRWVLGESSARQLRGESMQDVIFNGSLKRKPVSRASVELIFDNSIKVISGMWSAYDEISIKRQLARSGESTYYINNQVVRRKDITDLFLGTGVGTRGYAIIEQGMISRVIDAKPEELRLYLEEAAGVSKYREKRKDTVAKLEDTKDNLIRIEDINSELVKQINNLTIQAEAAHKYQHLQNELKLQQIILTQLKIAKSDTILNEINTTIDDIRKNTINIEISIGKYQQDLEEKLVLKSIKDDEISKLTEKFNMLRTDIARLEERQQHNKNLKERIDTDKLKLTQELVELEFQISEAKKEYLEINARISINNTEIEEKQIVRENQLIMLELALDEYNKICANLNSKVTEVSQSKHALDISKNTYEHKKQQLQNFNNRLKKLEQEKDDNILDFNQSYFAIKDEIVELEDELMRVEEELTVAKTSKLDLGLEINKLSSTVYEVKSEKTSIMSKLATISELLNKQVAPKGDVVNFINSEDILSPLWQNIVVLSGYELAVEVALGDVLNSIHLLGFNKIKKLPDSLTTFWVGEYTAARPINLEDGIDTLNKFVTIKDEKFASIYNILSIYIVCDNFDTGLALIKELSEEQVIITKDGHLLTKNYVTFNALSSQNHILEYQSKISVLENELNRLDSKLVKLEEELLQGKTKCTKYENTVTRLEESYNQSLKKKHELQLKFTKEEQIFIQNKHYQEKITEEYNLLIKEIEYIDNEIEEIKIKIEDSEIDVEYLREKLNLVELEKKEIEIKYNLAKSDLSNIDEALQNKITGNELLKQKFYNFDELVKEKEIHIERNREKISDLETDANNLIIKDDANELQFMQDEINNLGSALEEKNKETNATITEIGKLRRDIDGLLKEKEKLVVQLNQLALRQQEQVLSLQNYNEALFGMGAEDYLYDKASDSIKKCKFRVSEVQEQINVLNCEVEKLGLVNLKAIEDLEDCNNKHQDIVSKVSDLKESITMLEGAILQIDEETRSLLTDTYNRVNQIFTVYFKTLFGGGSANLELSEKDILVSGMQIFAEPPGKKNSSIQLLSGGEKALTAMSLVFAFFNLNPAPFCLLDEVDAPLDDANTSRFCNLVQELALKVQFVYISHNRLAMEMADQLIGVTMQEKGISTTVSVNLVEAVKHAV